MKRREFINLTSTSALLSSVETLAQEIPLVSNVDPKFQLKIMATNWGLGRFARRLLCCCQERRLRWD